MENCYLLTPNSEEAKSFSEKTDLLNRWNKNSIEFILHPNSKINYCYRIELKPSLVEFYKDTLESLNVELFCSAKEYLIKYPPQQNENFI